MNELSLDDKWRLITRGIPRGELEGDYVIDEEECLKILEKRDLRIYWGTATTGAPHLGTSNP